MSTRRRAAVAPPAAARSTSAGVRGRDATVPSGPSPSARAGRRGFTLLELLTVLVVSAIILTLGGLAFSGFFQRSAARRAATVFQQDLAAARSYAIRSRERVVLRFYESGLWYQVETQDTDTELLRRRFGANGDIELTAVTLNTQGDSIVFTSRGMANFTPAGGGLGAASFSSGPTTYTVSFNGMGASKIDQT